MEKGNFFFMFLFFFYERKKERKKKKALIQINLINETTKLLNGPVCQISLRLIQTNEHRCYSGFLFLEITIYAYQFSE